jgi:transcriptional regulator
VLVDSFPLNADDIAPCLSFLPGSGSQKVKRVEHNLSQSICAFQDAFGFLLDRLGEWRYAFLERRGEQVAESKSDKQNDLLQGTLDMLILKAVSLGPLHGYGVLLRIQQISGEELVIQQGSLYPALYRLERQGAIASEWGESENNRRAKYYRLTALGRSRLREETEKWNRMAGIIGSILRAT